MADDIAWYKDGFNIEIGDGSYEEIVLYMTEDDAKYFDFETSLHFCLKSDWERIQEIYNLRDMEVYQMEACMHSIAYLETILKEDGYV